MPGPPPSSAAAATSPEAELKRMGEPAYLESLNGTLGLDPTLLPPG